MMEKLDNRMIRGITKDKVVGAGLAAPTDLHGDSKAHQQFSSQLLSSPRRNDEPQLITEKSVTDASEDCDGIIRVPSGSGYRIMTPFPWRLHEMLEDIEEKNLDWIVSWMPDGKAFQVHSPEHFADTIIPMYFRHKRYKSFQRQLYLYGFRSLQVASICKGAYFHPCFARENRALCRQIVRPKSVSSNSSRTTSRSRSKKASQSEASRCSDADTVESSSTVELKQTLLGGTFEPLSCNRGMPALIGYSGSEKQSKDTSRTQTVVPRYTGVVSPPLTDLGQDEGSPSDSQQMATESLLKNLQLAMAGRGFPMPAGSELPDFLQGGVTVSNASSFEGRERLEIHEPHIPAGPILSMSTGNWNWMNVETHASEGPGVSLLSSGRYGTASIQELEPYSDSIITLFGSCSDFLD